MITTLKKITRIGIYSALLGILSFFGFLFLKNKREYHITDNPSLSNTIPSAHAESGDSTDSDSSDSDSSDSDSDSSSGDSDSM